MSYLSSDEYRDFCDKTRQDQERDQEVVSNVSSYTDKIDRPTEAQEKLESFYRDTGIDEHHRRMQALRKDEKGLWRKKSESEAFLEEMLTASEEDDYKFLSSLYPKKKE